MSELCEYVEDIVKLWYETQRGCMHKCLKKQHEFSDMMWKLHAKIQERDNGKTD